MGPKFTLPDIIMAERPNLGINFNNSIYNYFYFLFLSQNLGVQSQNQACKMLNVIKPYNI